MALVLADRVRETTTTTGTGSVTLAGAYTGFQTFSAAVGNTNSTYYTIANVGSGEWEVGIGTYSSGGNLLSRTTVLASSNGGSLVNFGAGAKDVFVTQPAERALYIASAGTGLESKVTAFTNGGIVYASSTSALATGSALTYDGTNFANTLSANASAGIRVTNSNAGASTSTNTAYSNGTNTHEFGILGTGYTTYGVLAAGDAYIYAGSGKNIALSADGGGAIKFGTGASANEKMRLDASGNLLLAGTSQRQRITVGTTAVTSTTTPEAIDLGATYSSVAGQNLKLYTFNDGTTKHGIGVSTGSSDYLTPTSGKHTFYTATTASMTLDASGNLGIGTTSPAEKLVIGNGTASEYINVNINGGTSANYGPVLNFLKGGTGFGQISNYGRIQGGTSSDFFITSVGANALIFGIGQAEKARIDSSGNFFVSTGYISATNTSNTTVATGGFDASTSWSLKVANASTTAGTGAGIFFLGGTNSESWIGNLYESSGVGALSFQTRVAGVRAERMRIDSSGNLGIGTTSPTQKLTVVGNILTANASGTDRYINISTNGVQNTFLGFNNSGSTNGNGVLNNYSYVGNGNAYGLQILANGSVAATFDTSGNLLVGTTSYGGAANTAGFGANPVGQIAVERDGGAAGVFNRFSSDGQLVLFRRQGTTVGSIDVTTSLTTYTTTSDYRLKNITGPVTGAKDFIMALQPKQGTWKADGSKFVGFLAHEFQEVSPSSVSGIKDAVDADGKPIMQAMQASSAEVMANLISLVQEQQALITQLTARITALEGA